MQIPVTQGVNIRGFTRREESPHSTPLSRSLREPSQQPSKSKQSGVQSFSGQHGGNSSFIRSVPGQGLICFKCGKSHRASECSFSGTCNTCGKEGHSSMVCKRNPNCIIKWPHSGSSSAGSTSVASSRGSAPTVGAPRGTVQMMARPPAPYSSCPQYYYPPPGYYWPPP